MSQVQLQRPHNNVQWGFRLQGGRDFSAELSVKKVMPGSPADGFLRSGDCIKSIGNKSTHDLTHMEANNIIKSSGNVIQFTIVRGVNTDFSGIKPTGPVKFSPWKHQAPQQSYLQ